MDTVGFQRQVPALQDSQATAGSVERLEQEQADSRDIAQSVVTQDFVVSRDTRDSAD